MGGWVKSRNLHPSIRWNLEQAGIIPGVVANKAVVYRYATAAPYLYWSARDGRVDQMYSTIALGYAGMTSGRNDVLLLTPEGHTLGADELTWSNSHCHMIGMIPIAIGYQRARIGHSGVCSPMLTVSGNGNLFANLRFMHGNGDASNLNLLTVTGAGNTFQNCDFAGPINATEGATAAYKTAIISGGSQNYFVGCTFGAVTAAMSAANCLLNFASTNGGNMFEDCHFYIQANAVSPFFINVTDTFGGNEFVNCVFDNVRGQATSMTYGISWTPAGGGLDMLFHNSIFKGVGDIIATGNVSRAVFTTYGETTTKIGIAQQTTVG